jgi:hypothetical protein
MGGQSVWAIPTRAGRGTSTGGPSRPHLAEQLSAQGLRNGADAHRMAETHGGSGRSLSAGKGRAQTIPSPQNHRSITTFRYNIGKAKHGRKCRPWDLLQHRKSRHDQANHEDRQEKSQR